jgi:c-di-GMP-binding flagellar brake protein YcgR
MSASLKRAFQGERNPAGEKIISRKKIIAILRQLQEGHELLGVTVPGCTSSSNTAVLGIKEGLDRFFLDELNNRGAHKAFLKQRKARIQCRLQGMELHFACQLLRASSKGGIALYELALPKAIGRVQRRQYFRLRLNPGASVPVTIPNFAGERVSGEAFDISAGGIGAFFQTRSIPTRGQLLHDVSISLPQSRPLSLDLEVRFARLDSTRHMLRFGGRFVNLDRKQERQLTLFLAEQQRKRTRYGPG